MTGESPAEIRLKPVPNKVLLFLLWMMIIIFALIIIASAKVQNGPWKIAYWILVPLSYITNLVLTDRRKVVVRATSVSLSIGAPHLGISNTFNWDDIRDVRFAETVGSAITVNFVDPTKLDQEINFQIQKTDLPAFASFIKDNAPGDNCLREAVEKLGAKTL